jgi:hypothetical protein
MNEDVRINDSGNNVNLKSMNLLKSKFVVRFTDLSCQAWILFHQNLRNDFKSVL